MNVRLLSLLIVLVAAACTAAEEVPQDPAVLDSIARARQDSFNRAQPGYIVDSILPVEEELRRFRADLADAPGALGGGAESRDELVRHFLDRLQERDTTALVAMLMSRAEFAYLVYPESPWTRPPYRQAPGLVWMQGSRASSTGLARLLERLGGRDLKFRSYTCAAEPEVLGENRIWRECSLDIEREPGQRQSMRLFNGIIERNGHFKFYTYGNDL